jgi:hypothetical protein
MPAQFTLYSDKNSEILVSSVQDVIGYASTYTTVLTGNVLNAASNSNKIGDYIVTKVASQDASGNVWSQFDYSFQITSPNDGIPTGAISFTLNMFNQTSFSSNPSETIPSGSSSVTLTNGLTSAISTGAYCNQFGYVQKTKSASNFRTYAFTFPQLVASYTNVFDSLPQPSVAPLA